MTKDLQHENNHLRASNKSLRKRLEETKQELREAHRKLSAGHTLKRGAMKQEQKKKKPNAIFQRLKELHWGK